MNTRLNHLLNNLDKVKVDKYPKGKTIYHPTTRMCVRHTCIICTTFGFMPDDKHDVETFTLAQKLVEAKGINGYKKTYYKPQKLEYGANLEQANNHVLDFYRRELL